MATKTSPKAKPDKPAKAKKKVPDYASPAALHRYDFETQKETALIEKDVGKAKDDYIDKKDRAAEAKKLYEAESDALRKYIRDRAAMRGKSPKQPTLTEKFDDAAKDAEMKAANAKATQAATATDQAWPPEDLWKSFPVERLKDFGLTASDVEKLHAGEVKKGVGIGPIMTMGDLSKFTEPIGGSTYARQLIDLKGIGKAGVDRISDADTAFWTAWKGPLAEKFALESGLSRPDPAKAKKPRAKKGKADGKATVTGDGGTGDPVASATAAGADKSESDSDGPAE